MGVLLVGMLVGFNQRAKGGIPVFEPSFLVVA